ncbi:hypothetical protein [Leifsonia sp. Root60]|uniref:hypothetical protein n=2 Tax=unclassified Leifsonia TaxID=2663824 RepID=UPI0006F6FBCB|nr:hypothetical protein [Leifsonia sp. Root60]KQX07702.1 hypothetical protein ASC59_08200 [Leifsonia sp. Root1293]KRA11984.1 hypothetical protein ASD61_08200 [Leifsonia sp. Root60]
MRKRPDVLLIAFLTVGAVVIIPAVTWLVSGIVAESRPVSDAELVGEWENVTPASTRSIMLNGDGTASVSNVIDDPEARPVSGAGTWERSDVNGTIEITLDPPSDEVDSQTLPSDVTMTVDIRPSLERLWLVIYLGDPDDYGTWQKYKLLDG